MTYLVKCKNCGIERELSYKAYWYVNSKLSKGYCKKCSPKNLEGLKRGHGWNRGLLGFMKGHLPYFVAYGKLNPAWKGGVTPINTKIRNSKEYALWRKSVFERDNYICQECGIKGGNLNADHIKPFAYYPELRFDLNNGRTLCVDCHKKTDTYLSKAYQHALYV